MQSIYFFQIGFVNLYEYVAILLIFSPLSGFPSVQISSIAAGATVYYYQLDNNKKRYMTYNTYTVGFFNLIIVLIWQLFLLNFLEILVSCQRRETVQSYSPQCTQVVLLSTCQKLEAINLWMIIIVSFDPPQLYLWGYQRYSSPVHQQSIRQPGNI